MFTEISQNPIGHLHTQAGFSYYEYKYLISHENLYKVHQLLEAFLGHSDPFPQGIVDSIYYDTQDEDFFNQCLNGEAHKTKFRIRGYGDGQYLQIHQKTKNLSSVIKYKSKILPQCAPRERAPQWEDLEPIKQDYDFTMIQYQARYFAPLFPSIRVKYSRFRYRCYDYRITLDTNIEVYAPINGLPRHLSYATIPYHVLEIKTREKRPTLPFIGLMTLQQVSFSKFMLGLNLLNGF